MVINTVSVIFSLLALSNWKMDVGGKRSLKYLLRMMPGDERHAAEFPLIHQSVVAQV